LKLASMALAEPAQAIVTTEQNVGASLFRSRYV
jgi:hypothetical protein